ncbi:aminoglycoside phosphotransferase [Sphingobium chlorophenolicum L-1]|uniref:Aminoglycoside phosphotransferase n=1 Tax=Sphingobium chlorophenolicum L-1 TaxID=690566 RepID=F6EUG7_SPHCR|nr:oxidoreductase family protein [Sphingobium chlorophenolicum]AEG47861.1 aminoglycoside phosphotransferase [Sphingobium chlorophenolicum L-1]
MNQIISALGLLSPARLTKMVRAHVPGDYEIIHFDAEGVGNGLLGDSIRLSLSYNRDCSDLPKSLIAKFSPTDAVVREAGARLGVYRTEIGFYSELASSVAVSRPEAFYAEIDEAGEMFGLIMEDLGPARGGDQLSGCSVEDARLVMKQAAALHGPLWNNPSSERPWMQMQRVASQQLLVNFGVFVDAFINRLGSGLNDDQIKMIYKYQNSALDFYNYQTRHRTLIHMDLRLDNILFDARDGAIPCAILDWQTASFGSAARDLGFFLCTSLPLHIRRACERDILAEYLEHLRAHGVNDYTFEQLWSDYQLSSYQALFTAIAASYSAKRTERADLMFTKMAKEGAALLDDLDATSALAAALDGR